MVLAYNVYPQRKIRPSVCHIFWPDKLSDIVSDKPEGVVLQIFFLFRFNDYSRSYDLVFGLTYYLDGSMVGRQP